MKRWHTKEKAKEKADLEKTVGTVRFAVKGKNFNFRDAWSSSMPGFIHHKDEDLIDNWLSKFRFENPRNKLFGYKLPYKSIAVYWMRYGKHRPNKNDSLVVYGQNMWDKYIKKFVAVEVAW
jgi:hypothetical protein